MNKALYIAAVSLVLLGASFLAAVWTKNVNLAFQLATVTLLALVAFMQVVAMDKPAKTK